MTNDLDALTGPATFEQPGASPDTPRKLTNAEAARLLKKELRARFPGVAFSVRSDRGSAWGWFSVSWTDGPRWRDVERVTSPCHYASFNGMTDGYDHHKRGAVLLAGEWIEPFSRGINCHRRISEDYARQLVAAYCARYTGSIPPTGEFKNGDWFAQAPNPSDAGTYRWNWQDITHRLASGDLTLGESNS
jgi:hypothetical protein